MIWFNLIFAFVLGSIVGSFLNVVALRFRTGLSPFSGRSKCFVCGKTLHFYELIPVLSFLFLFGRCSKCRSKISWRYPLIEIITGFLFVGILLKTEMFLAIGFWQFVLAFLYLSAVWGILTVIVLYDIKHKIIPDILVFAFCALSLLQGFMGGMTDFLYTLLAGVLICMPFYFLWLISSGKWIGLGDSKLAFGIGCFLGISGGLSAVALAFWIGAVFGLLFIFVSKYLPRKYGLSLFTKHLTIKSEIPFAPFLILGTALVFFFGVQVFDFVGIMSF